MWQCSHQQVSDKFEEAAAVSEGVRVCLIGWAGMLKCADEVLYHIM